MKRLILLSLILLASCVSSEVLKGERLEPNLVHYSALEGPNLSVATSTTFESVPEGCERVEGFMNQLWCIAPAEYYFVTDGRTSANIADGFIPKSRFVVVE